jgi:hypothetical protein
VIAWQNLAAFWALSLLIAPIIVHLLRRHRADRVLFPSLRFVYTSQTAAVRMRPPADWILLGLRMAILAAAVAALAGPIALTDSRVSQWNATTARAVVVDTSDSLRAAADGTTAAASASEAAEAEIRSAAYGRRFETADLTEGIERASRWLRSTPPSRKEILVISDFQRGALDVTAITDERSEIDRNIGLRLMRVGRSAGTARIDGAPLLGTAEIAGRQQTIDLERDSTGVAFERVDRTRPDLGLRLLTSAGRLDDAGRITRAVAMAGTPAGSDAQPIVVRFAGSTAKDVGTAAPIRAGWMLRTVRRLSEDLDLQTLAESAQDIGTVPISGDPPWAVVIRRDGRPLLAAAALQDELMIDAAVASQTFLAAAIVRAALTARRDARDYQEQEIALTSESVLASLERPAGSVDRTAWRHVEATDARWCWAAALALLAVEQWLRAKHTRSRHAQEDARAAA